MRIYILFSLCVLVLIGINNQLLGRTLFAKTIPQPTNKPIKLLNSDISNTSIIQDLIRKKNWNSIKSNIANIKHPLLKKILLWQYYISPNSGAKFYEIETFLSRAAHIKTQARRVCRDEYPVYNSYPLESCFPFC